MRGLGAHSSNSKYVPRRERRYHVKTEWLEEETQSSEVRVTDIILWSEKFPYIEGRVCALEGGVGGCCFYRWEGRAPVPLLFAVHCDTKLVLDTPVRLAFDRPSDASRKGSFISDRRVKCKLNRETALQGAHDTAWLHKWAFCYGLFLQVDGLVRPGCTSGLIGTAWLYKWTVWYGLAVQVGCFEQPGCTSGLFGTAWL